MSEKIGLFYGSSTSNTEYIAYDLQEIINKLLEDAVDIPNIGSTQVEEMQPYRYLIFGIPTWDIGELQADWDIFLPKLTKANLSGQQVSLFGLGDQYGYADTFLDAI